MRQSQETRNRRREQEARGYGALQLPKTAMKKALGVLERCSYRLDWGTLADSILPSLHCLLR